MCSWSPYGGIVKLKCPVTGEDKCKLTGHSEGVTSVAISADGKRVVSGSQDRTAKIWDVETGAEVRGGWWGWALGFGGRVGVFNGEALQGSGQVPHNMFIISLIRNKPSFGIHSLELWRYSFCAWVSRLQFPGFRSPLDYITGKEGPGGGGGTALGFEQFWNSVLSVLSFSTRIWVSFPSS